MMWVAPWNLLEQIAASLVRDAGNRIHDEIAYSVLIAEEDTGL